MCEYDDLEVGDVFYYPAGHPINKANTWTIVKHKYKMCIVAVREDSDNTKGTQISKTQWYLIRGRNRLIPHKTLLSDFGEETIFLHTLADTLHELLSSYGPPDQGR